MTIVLCLVLFQDSFWVNCLSYLKVKVFLMQELSCYDLSLSHQQPQLLSALSKWLVVMKITS